MKSEVDEDQTAHVPSSGSLKTSELSAAPSLKLTRENGSFIPEVFTQVLIAANCGVSGHFRFQENGGNCTMCQRTAAMEIENKRLHQEEQHFLNRQKVVENAIRAVWPSLQTELRNAVNAVMPVYPDELRLEYERGIANGRDTNTRGSASGTA